MAKKNLIITIVFFAILITVIVGGVFFIQSSSKPVNTNLPPSQYKRLEKKLLSLGLYKNSDGHLSGELTLSDGTFARITDLNKDGSLSLVKQEKKGSTVYVKSKASFAKVKAFLSRMEAVNQ